ncbi:hypothetical protein BJ165DRAFT_684887 [Panaeolus papilionaceus]|nr:hypothetical protein BJ165DRAFT_684887 [Panaeolus papilionaceus]
MANIHLSQGALLIGAYFNLILFTIEIVFVYIYFISKRSRDDPKVIKYAVIATLFFDTIGTVGTLATSYLLSITFAWRGASIQPPLWSLSVWVLCTAIVAAIVHTFMNRRVFILSKSYIICGIILILTIVTFTFFVLLTGITIAKERTLSTRYQDVYMVSAAFGTGALTDVVITVALLWQLRATPIHTRTTRILIRKISSMAITTGGITTALSLADLIAFVAKPEAGVSTAIGFIVGRAYSLTMLFTLNYRARIVEASELESSMLPSETGDIETVRCLPLSLPV